MRRRPSRAVIHVAAHGAVVPAAACCPKYYGEGSDGLPVKDILPCPDRSMPVRRVEFYLLP